MKRIFTVLAASIVVVLAACGGQAHAQNPTKLVYSANTQQGAVTFSIRDVRKITVDGGALILTYENGTNSGQYLLDNGTVFNKIKNDHPEFLTHASNTLYIDSKSRSTTCQGGQTVFGWAYNVGAESVNDGCQLYQQSLSKAQ